MISKGSGGDFIYYVDIKGKIMRRLCVEEVEEELKEKEQFDL